MGWNSRSAISQATAVLCCALLLPGEWRAHAWQGPVPHGASSEAPMMTPAQLDDLVAPIALYADPLVGQILAASTYPLEVVAADRWLQANSGLQGAALTDAAKNQPWDPSVQALVVFSTVLSMMDKNLAWTTDLGNAFLAQESDVMNAIQRQRQRAADTGMLASNAQHRVERSTQDNKTVIVIQPAQPEVVYVPVYNPAAIWGPPVYDPWPAFWYPPRPPASTIIAGGLAGFFIGVTVANRFHNWGGWGGWGWGCGWHNRTVVVNNNFYIRNNYRPPPVPYRNGTGNWAHDPVHRAGVPYSSAAVATRVGAPSAGITRPAPQPGGGGAAARPLPANRPGRPATQPRNDNASIRLAPQPGSAGGAARPTPLPNRPGRPAMQTGSGNAAIRPAPQPANGGATARPSPFPNRASRPAKPPSGNAATRPAQPPAPAVQPGTGSANRARIDNSHGPAASGNRATPRPGPPSQPRPPAQARPTGRPAPNRPK